MSSAIDLGRRVLTPLATSGGGTTGPAGIPPRRPPLTCRDMPRLLLQYFERDGTLTGERLAAVKWHLKDCRPCRLKLLALEVAFA